MSAVTPPLVPMTVSLANSWRTVRNPIEIFDEYTRRSGHNFFLRLGGSTLALITTDPELTQQVLQRNHRNYQKSHIQTEQLAHYLGKGLLTNEGEDWLRQRRLIQPGFHRDRLQGLYTLMHRVALDTVEQLAAQQGAAVDVCPVMMQTAFRIMGQTMFSEGMSDSQLLFLSDSVTRLQAFIIKPLRLPFLQPWLRLSGQIRKHEELARDAFAILDTLVAERKRQAQPAPDLLQMLLDARYEDNGEPMSDRRLLEEVIVLLVAGHETSANALAWACYLLAQHKDCMAQLQEELDRNTTDGAPDLETLKKLPYLTQVIEESLRLYPPAWITDRVALDADEANGVGWPKGTLVTPYIYGLHHHPDFWTEPERFKPERMSAELKRERPAYAYIPFGGGPRLCIGYSFAMMEMQVVLAALVRRFNISLAPGQHIWAKPLISLRPEPGIRLHFSPR